MSLTAEELAAVCAELEPALLGQPVHKVVQRDEHSVLLSLRGQWLLLCASPRAGRLHLLGDKPAGTGEAATAFCMLLRKHLEGARVVSLSAVPGERACELEFAASRSGSDDTPRLRLFLFGASAQLQLWARGDDDEPRVLGAIGPAKRDHAALPPPRDNPTPRLLRFSPPLSPAIEAHYAALERDAGVDDARRAARARVDDKLRKIGKLIVALRADLARADRAEARKKEGDLLLAHLADVPKGARTVTLPDDFIDGAPIEIALDPARSARQNAERLYKEHKRLGRARATIARRIDETTASIATLEVERGRIDDAPAAALLTDARQPAPHKRRHEPGRTLPYRRYASGTGAPIFVGRGAAKNDELTWKIARGNDLWLHTRDVPGAHVVVPLEGGRAVDAETLVDAATLAAHHSNARDEAQVDVGYALRKHLRKPRGGAPGQVLVSQQKTIRVRLEPARLERLLKSRADD